MTDQELLDHFAGCALTGIATNVNIDAPQSAIARMAYIYADAMLAERKKHLITAEPARLECMREKCKNYKHQGDKGIGTYYYCKSKGFCLRMENHSDQYEPVEADK